MRFRKILICVLTSMLCFSIFCPKAADAAQTPQEFVKEFYEWYIIKHYEHHAILKEEKLPEYVDVSLIEELEKKDRQIYIILYISVKRWHLKIAVL